MWVDIGFDFYLGEPVFLEHVFDDPWRPHVDLVCVVSCSTEVETFEVSVSRVEVAVNAEDWWFEVRCHSVSILW